MKPISDKICQHHITGNTTLKALLFAFFALLINTSFAEDLRYYDIEIVVIENLTESARNSEHWPLEVTINKPINTVILGEPPLVEWLPLEADLAESFKMLTPEEFQLNTEVEKIAASKTQRVIFHTAWRQPGLSKKITLPVYFKHEVTDNPVMQKIADVPLIISVIDNPVALPPVSILEGMFRVTLSRYLHLEAELIYRIPAVITSMNDAEWADENKLDEIEKQGVIYLKQKRNRIRSNELHYIDHPVISFLVKMTPYIKPEVTDQSLLIKTN